MIHPVYHARLSGEMNSPEAFYARELLRRLDEGMITSVGFELITLTLTHNKKGTPQNRMRFTPDFFVECSDHMEFHEVKEIRISKKGKKWSSMREDAKVKLKMAVELYPMFGWKLIEVNLKTNTWEEIPF